MFITRKCQTQLCYICSILECAKNLLNVQKDQEKLKFVRSCCNEENQTFDVSEIVEYFYEMSSYETIDEKTNLCFNVQSASTTK